VLTSIGELAETANGAETEKSPSLPLLHSPPRRYDGKTSCSGRFYTTVFIVEKADLVPEVF
jgi:hypothetical protein